MGRKPIPDALKKARGTFREDRANNAQPQFTVMLTAEPPEELNEVAKDYWKDIVTELTDAGILQTPDTFLLIALCNEIATYISLCEDIDKLTAKIYTTENGTVKERPEYKMRRECLKQIVTLSSLFGLSPAYRQKLIAPSLRKKESALSKLLNG